MHRLLAQLGDPQDAWQAVHISGTKGKGSTATMLASIASAAGLKTGCYTRWIVMLCLPMQAWSTRPAHGMRFASPSEAAQELSNGGPWARASILPLTVISTFPTPSQPPRGVPA